MFSSLFNKGKEYGRQAVEQGKQAVKKVRKQVEDTGKSYAQQQRENLKASANSANWNKKYYK